jgi:hypothetical protein
VVIGAVVVLALKVRARPERAASDKAVAKAEEQFRKQERLASPVLDRANARAAAANEPAPAAPPPPRPAPVPREVSPESATYSDPAFSSIRMPPDDDLKARMDAAHRLFDTGEYPAAEEAALAILEGSPRNVKMLRIVVSTACAMGNVERAKEYYAQLPSKDQEQMRKRCKKWTVDLEASASP